MSARFVKHERRTRHGVALHLDEVPDLDHAPLRTRIVLFRTLEEAVSNATRHGLRLRMRAERWCDRGQVVGGVIIRASIGGLSSGPPYLVNVASISRRWS